MKYFTFLTLIFLLTTFGCKKSNQSPTTSIIGKWIHTKTILQSDQNGNLTPIETINYSDSNNYVQFNENGTGLISQFDGIELITVNFTYTFTNTTLTITSDGSTTNNKVTLLSQNSLIIQSAPFSSGTSLQVSVDYFSK